MVIDFFIYLDYICFSQYIKPYHLFVSPPFGVLTGISYDPPLTDPFNFINKNIKLHMFPTLVVEILLIDRKFRS